MNNEFINILIQSAIWIVALLVFFRGITKDNKNNLKDIIDTKLTEQKEYLGLRSRIELLENKVNSIVYDSRLSNDAIQNQLNNIMKEISALHEKINKYIIDILKTMGEKN